MNTNQKLHDADHPDWAYPLLRILVVGAFFEIVCTSVMVLFARTGFLPKALHAVVDYLVVGAVITSSAAIVSVLWYLRIRHGLAEGCDS